MPERRVLMISPHFPPDTSAAAHRVRLLAPHLPAFGWTPTVLTVEPDAYEGALDWDLSRLVPGSVEVVRARTWRARTTRRFGFGDLGLRALVGLRRTARRLLAGRRFDALFITIFPPYPAMLGRSLKARFDVPFVLDYQDPWVGAWGRDVGGGPGGRPDLRSRAARRLGERLEPRVVGAADAVTAVSVRTIDDIAYRLPDVVPAVRAALPLGFELGDRDAVDGALRANRQFDGRDGRVHLVYVGTVLPRGVSVLRALLSAVATLTGRQPAIRDRLRLHFFGTSNQRGAGQRPRVLPLAEELGLVTLVHEVPARIDYLDALRVQIDAHAVMLLGSDEPHYTPSKVFPALLSGRPLLAVYHEASSVVDLLAACPLATTITFPDGDAVAGRVASIAEVIDRLVREGPVSAERPVLDDPRISRWSARSIAGDLARVLDAVASPRSADSGRARA
ncbi:MAG: glycosyltransferase family 4 protein [Acidimicrobiia bacterium]|nr:glycosyltransferase family 4 protein [Acidimicrobiia bacterium]